MHSKFGKILLLAAMALAITALGGGNAMAQDGKAMYQIKGCAACHGPDGKAPVMPNYPRLAGQNAEYMVQQINDFKTQKRSNNLAALMFGMVAPLTEAEIKALTDYLAAVK